MLEKLSSSKHFTHIGKEWGAHGTHLYISTLLCLVMHKKPRKTQIVTSWLKMPFVRQDPLAQNDGAQSEKKVENFGFSSTISG